MKKKFNNQKTRTIASIISGIILSVLIFTIAITVGYMQIENSSLTEYSVNVLWLNIFNIQKEGNELIGTPNTNNMMFIGIMLAMIIAITTEVVLNIKKVL